jgi:very-short-patch-repair endonuclease
MRRTLVAQYYDGENWEDIATLRRFASVLERTSLLSFIEEPDKDKLRDLCNRCGFEVDSNGHTVHLTKSGVGRQVKNLIFAADGPKPEIVLSDSISNDIEIVKNAKYCLIYDRPIQTHGLLLRELIGWWREMRGNDQVSEWESRNDLLLRLRKSLASPPETLLFESYYRAFHRRLGNDMPALVPQVYLHYDPYTIRQLQGKKRLLRQRMDFLLLLSDRTRIVIEVDGKQHYADGDSAKPELYAEMVSEDRKLKLAGYQVYRFGGYELRPPQGDRIVEDFFSRLFERHEVILSST